ACDIGVIPTDLGRRIVDRRELPQIVLESSSGQTEEAGALTQGELRVVRLPTNEDAFVVEVVSVSPDSTVRAELKVFGEYNLSRQMLGLNRPVDDQLRVDGPQHEEAVAARAVRIR